MKVNLYTILTLFMILAYSSVAKAQDSAYKEHELDSIRQRARVVGYNGDIHTSVKLYETAIKGYNKLNKPNKYIPTTFDRLLIEYYDEEKPIEERLSKIEKAIAKTEQTPTLNASYKAIYLFTLLIANNTSSFEQRYTSTVAQLKREKLYLIIQKMEANLAFIFYTLGDLEKTQEHCIKAEQYISQLKDTPQEEFIDTYSLQAALYYSLGDFEKAVEGSLNSIDAMEKYYYIDSIGLAFEYNNLGSVYSTLNDEANATLYYQKAWETINQYKGYFPAIEKIGFLSNLLQSKSSSGQHVDIFSQYKEVIETLEAYEDKSNEQWKDLIIAYNYTIRFLAEEKRFDIIKHYIQRAEQIINEAPSLKSDMYEAKADVAIQQENFEEALAHINRAIHSSEVSFGKQAYGTIEIFSKKSNILYALGDLPKALITIQLALKRMSIGSETLSAYQNPPLENIRYKNEFSILMGLKIQILNTLYKKNPDPKIIDAIYDCTKLATDALVEVNRTFKNTNSKRIWLNKNAIPFYESAIGTAYDLAQSTGNARYWREAFQLCEQSKSMMMTDVLQEQQAVKMGGVPEELVQQQTELERLVAATEKERFDANTANDKAAEKAASDQLFEYKHQLDLLRHRFELEYPKYYELKYSTPVTTVEDVQAILQDGDYLVEYFEGDKHLYCFIIHKDGLAVKQLKKTSLFNIRLKQFQLGLMDITQHLEQPITTYNNYIKEAHRLYQHLISFVDLQAAQRLIIVPDGQLSYLPFEVLLTESLQPVAKDDFRGANFARLPYLLRKAKVNYLYSAQLWLQQLQQEQRTNNGQILGFAPTYQGVPLPDWRQQRELTLRKKLSDLPGAAEEVRQLQEHYRGSYFSGLDANEALFKAKADQYSILHLAMHGLIDQTNPEFSGLAMTEDQNRDQDNFLYAYEIKQLPLSADLVVLSACETGIGKYQRGEGVVSIGRGFFYAGAPALLMTLWSLNDQSGAFIMKHFYENLQQGMTKDEAIRQAKLHYLESFAQEYAHPFMWAAFVPVGDYSPIELQSANYYWWYIGGAALLLFLLGGLVYFVKRKR